MIQVLVGVAVLTGGGLLALLAGRQARLANAIGVASAVAGSTIALLPVLGVLAAGEALPDLSRAWSVPFGVFAIGLDPLSAWFAAVVLGLSILVAVYGAGYLLSYADRKLLGPPWFFFNLLVAAMTLVVIARNGLLFLMAWEGMALASFFLVTFEDEQASVREAGRLYLTASHLGAACLLLFFALLVSQTGTLEFGARSDSAPQPAPPAEARLAPGGSFASRSIDPLGDTRPRSNMSSELAGVLFLLALIGFGVKAGMMPLHVWLPEAHPAAPSHVSALMSGAMVKTGIYGLLRAVAILGPPPAWWGWLLVLIGLSSGLLGMLFALAQQDLKRLLAYSTVENVGIITLGLGVGLVGLSAGSPALAALGFAGGLLHVLNHAIFKGLLFLGAGAVRHGAGTLQLDRLGGLLKRMPLAGTAFVVGAAAICGLPPLNGFVSEFLIYLSALQSFRDMSLPTASSSVVALATMGGLGLMGGLAAACFTKAVGIVFLGEPRTESAAGAHPPSWLMTAAMLTLAAGCACAALAVGPLLTALTPALAIVAGLSDEVLTQSLSPVQAPLTAVVGLSGCVWLLGVCLAALRRWLLHGREVTRSATWGCGYAAPTARMQYTSTSYVQPLTDFFKTVLRLRKQLVEPVHLFPATACARTSHEDLFLSGLFARSYRGISWLLSRLHWLQHGRLHLYVLYLAVTLVVLLAWEFGLGAWLSGWAAWLAAGLGIQF